LLVVHVATLVGIILTGWSWKGLLLAVCIYFVRMVMVTAGYHRYFAHRAFKTSRIFQFLLAVGAESGGEKGVLWWASHHRWHHKYSDTEKDAHSAKQRGFVFAHIGWLFSKRWGRTDPTLIPDLYKYPELRLLDREGIQAIPIVAVALLCLGLWGLHGLIWGFGLSSVLLWHGSFAINSLAHLMGRQRYVTGDESRNSLILAIATTGEGWHNNHHHFPSSARQGFFWWEFDLTYYVLRGLELLGLVWDLRRVPDELLAGPRAVTKPAIAFHV
jgi:stearoyl-CoA desaturase (Delta-9 desaturase)